MLDETITPELQREGLMREVVRHVQAARKDAGLNVDDRIRLSFATSDDELSRAIYEFRDAIAEEVLQIEPSSSSGQYAHTSNVKIDGCDLEITLEKA